MRLAGHRADMQPDAVVGRFSSSRVGCRDDPDCARAQRPDGAGSVRGARRKRGMLDSWNRGLRAVALGLALAAPPAAAARRTPPAPVITSGPARPSAQTIAHFAFSGASLLRCRLDRARARRCARSATYRALAEGRHVFSVRATGRHGARTRARARARARATYAWTIDPGRPPRPVLSEVPD